MNEKEFDLGIVKRFFEHDYHDRGLMKWQGFYLSDHTAALNQQKIQDKQQYPPKPQQSLSIVGQILSTAYTQNQPVNLQLNTVDHNNQHFATITTPILGYNGATIVIANHQFININDIQHIELVRSTNWTGNQ
ncbi:DNA-directed RNA polymerase subunit beta [Lactiplantibacillus plantarum]|uniref:hypothetical protein n=1 Tax=Lactiplantibacillus plantarum TaxID=1590 RepID=UPI000FECCED3|nr:hypothetical protein [Lactiplantibacillus plantarum]MCB7177369.1 hypothetical protein [Lactiplantibacillus plantarum]MCG0622277.1 DNA-directed RNA polymerase subunit beta [Lactiplantibacillus plantarum]MCG0836231.1 DNA-directed RNA polymerase subunit beta [Lactiplantibacillus plantarum]MCG0915455.1 DNA-directed RNA polymerase subunit beta [Lactiplantibacillus plantarum]QAR39326.1 hypothetical protein EQJ27_15600 [Lactiplantibacillus plantarum]